MSLQPVKRTYSYPVLYRKTERTELFNMGMWCFYYHMHWPTTHMTCPSFVTHVTHCQLWIVCEKCETQQVWPVYYDRVGRRFVAVAAAFLVAAATTIATDGNSSLLTHRSQKHEKLLQTAETSCDINRTNF